MDVEYLVQRLSEEVFVQIWEYIAFPDDRICLICNKFKGRQYPYHETEKPQLPIHINCRCYYKSKKIAYDGKKSATLTGFAGKSRYIINEFTFDTDNNGRVIKAFGKLQSISGIRNARNQMRAAAWGRSGDEGGHLIPAKYGGPGHLLNILPQARNINRSVIKKIENEMGRHLKNGAVVEYTVKPVYTNPVSRRPDVFIVRYKINGKNTQRTIDND